jgi:hypothetical protein
MAQDEQRLSGALQENILTLLCFDDANCKLVRAAITPHLFESSVFKEVAGHAIDFIDQYGEAIKDHLPDQLESILEGDDQRKAGTYRKLLENLFQSRDSINSTYILQQLHKFVRQQNLKASVIKAVEALEDGRIDDAEVELQRGLNTQAVSFEPGLRLDSADDVGGIMDAPEEEGFLLGIPELDQRGIIPRRKELFCMLAPRGRGKSWFLTHCAKQALLQRWSVLVVTLEMSEKRYAARMLQSFFAISRREATVKVTRFKLDDDGGLQDVIREELERKTMKDEGIRETLVKRAKREFSRRKPLRIKAFSSGSLTIPQLKAYLEGLERFEKFTPDAILVDYPMLFALDSKNLRIELGKVNVDLRGIADERNAAVIMVSQGNRESETAPLVTGDMAAEDISLKATVDVLLTLSQTPAEHKLGVARILADKVRNDETGIQILITQAYAIGQFCLDSMRLAGEYWEMLKGKTDHREGVERRGGGDRRRPSEDGDERPRRRRGDEDDRRPTR